MQMLQMNEGFVAPNVTIVCGHLLLSELYTAGSALIQA
jgi:hypothetical protein